MEKLTFILGIILGAIVLLTFGCSGHSYEKSKSGQLEVTLYVSEDNPETYIIKYDKIEIDTSLDNLQLFTYSYNDVPVVMYSYNGNTIWIDEDMDGHDTTFNGKFLIKDIKE